MPLFQLDVYAKNAKASLLGSRQAGFKESAPLPDFAIFGFAIFEKELILNMPNAKKAKYTAAGRRLIGSVKQAIAWADGQDVPVRVTMVEVHRTPTTDVRSLRQALGLSQAQFAARFGFTAATVRNWEQGRTKPEGAARVLLAVIAHHPEAVEDALRKAS
jgi:putative transcriptional regulator